MLQRLKLERAHFMRLVGRSEVFANLPEVFFIVKYRDLEKLLIRNKKKCL